MVDQNQMRRNTDVAQDQVERISAQARQATRESFQVAQQTTQDLAQSTERLTEQGGQVASTAFSNTWDSYLALVGAVSWSQDQTEQAVRQLLDQGRVSREEGLRLLRDLTEQAKRNQAELQRLIQESVRASLQAWRVPGTALQPVMTIMTPQQPATGTTPQPAPAPSITPAQFEELNRKVDELNRKLDTLNTKTATTK